MKTENQSNKSAIPLDELKRLIAVFDTTGGYFAVKAGTLNENGLLLRDDMLAALKLAESEHAALLAVAEAAKLFAQTVEIQARGDLSDAEFRRYVSILSKKQSSIIGKAIE